MRVSTIAVLSVLTACSWMAGADENFHWQPVSGKTDEGTDQRMEQDWSQCMAEAHGFNVQTDQCMHDRGYEKHFD